MKRLKKKKKTAIELSGQTIKEIPKLLNKENITSNLNCLKKKKPANNFTS